MNIREDLSSEQRVLPLNLTIDPGFVHYRKIETILGPKLMPYIDDAINKLPNTLPDWQRPVRIDHIYTRYFLKWCSHNKIRSLADIYHSGDGRLVLSTERLGPCTGDIYTDCRITSEWTPPFNPDIKVRLEYSTRHARGDTFKGRISEGGNLISFIASVVNVDTKRNILKLEPIIMGFPWLESEGDTDFSPEWFSYDYYEIFIDDIEEFKKVKSIGPSHDFSIMKKVSEDSFKWAICKILGEDAAKDWGGESEDHYSPRLHLGGQRVHASLLLKGPGNGFRPMTLNNLGKNNDQIVRLSRTPSDLLIVQHCHDIIPEVRETLRALTVQPGRPRRYCLIDGKDSLRLLKAYDLLDAAIERTRSGVKS